MGGGVMTLGPSRGLVPVCVLPCATHLASRWWDRMIHVWAKVRSRFVVGGTIF